MASAAVRYETYISKENQAAIKDLLKQLGGFGSDEAYFYGWAQLLSGTRTNYALNESNAKSLVNSACEEYLRSLRENPALPDEIKNSPKNFPSLPTCSPLMTTASGVYVSIDFPDSMMPMFIYFLDPLANAFHSLGRYGGAVILRGPWFSYNDGTKGRYHAQYSLHWLGFIHDEVTSGVRTQPESLPLLTGHWVKQAGQSHPDSLFAKKDTVGTFIFRDAAIYKIARFQEHSKIQLTDGSEWMVPADTSSKCGLLVGDMISTMAQKSAEGADLTRLAKGPCALDATFVGAWPSSNGPIAKDAAIPLDRQATGNSIETQNTAIRIQHSLQMSDGTLLGWGELNTAIEKREEDCRSKRPQNNPDTCKIFLKGYKDLKAGRL